MNGSSCTVPDRLKRPVPVRHLFFWKMVFHASILFRVDCRPGVALRHLRVVTGVTEEIDPGVRDGRAEAAEGATEIAKSNRGTATAHPRFDLSV